MRIAASEVAFASAHAAHAQVQRRLEITVRQPASVASAPPRRASAVSPPAEAGVPPMLVLIKSILERLLGREIRLPELPPPSPQSPAPSIPGLSAPVVEIRYEEHRSETEQLAVAAQGVVVTRDGQRIGFRLELQLERHFAEDFELDLRTGALEPRKKDPLVINFNAASASLGSTRFSFDLDADGTTESVSTLGTGSAFLALDLDGNGRIDDGRELFGALSGDGFRDLERHDNDGNGWIDEDDPVYARLAVWQPGVDGEGALRSLSDADVGAIHLGRVESAFEYRDGSNSPLASLRSTGVYLKDSGGAGSVQQLDLFV